MIVEDFLGKSYSCSCIGCSIGEGDMTPPGGIITETENFVMHQDPEIPIRGFLIIASKRHIRSISELTIDESRELFDLVYRARRAMKIVEDINEVTIIQEERSGHFHLWLLPYHPWMKEAFESSLTAIRGIMKYAKDNLKNEENIKEIVLTVDMIRTELKRTTI